MPASSTQTEFVFIIETLQSIVGRTLGVTVDN